MDISVVIPIYGVEKYIERCLRSLFTQSKTEGVEFILVNDCTKDDSIVIAQRVIAEYPQLIVKIINHECNKGLACARHTGVSVACGDYIQHIDSDDWCESTMLEELYDEAVKNCADIVGCDYYIDDSQKSVYRCGKIPENNIEAFKMLLSSKLTQSLCFKLIKRELYQNDANFHIPGVNIWEDFVASSKLFYFARKVHYLPKAFYHYMIADTNSVSRSYFSKQKADNILMAVEDIEVFVAKYQLGDMLENEIICLKLYAKYTLIKLAKENRKQYCSLYPKLTRYILKHRGMPLHNRLALQLASYNSLFLFDITRTFVRNVKKIIGRSKNI